MNPDHQRNIEVAVHSIGEEMFRAWSFLHVMKGLQAGARANPKKVQSTALAVDVMYRALFNALFSAIGTILDRSKGTYSIPNLISKIRKYEVADADLRQILRRIEVDLTSPENVPLRKLERWRHDVIAHNTENGKARSFYPNNKMHLEDVENALAQLEEMVNRVSVPLLRAAYDWRTGSEKRCLREAEALLAS
jgi:hypothetical protein